MLREGGAPLCRVVVGGKQGDGGRYDDAAGMKWAASVSGCRRGDFQDFGEGVGKGALKADDGSAKTDGGSAMTDGDDSAACETRASLSCGAGRGS